MRGGMKACFWNTAFAAWMNDKIKVYVDKSYKFQNCNRSLVRMQGMRVI